MDLSDAEHGVSDDLALGHKEQDTTDQEFKENAADEGRNLSLDYVYRRPVSKLR